MAYSHPCPDGGAPKPPKPKKVKKAMNERTRNNRLAAEYLTPRSLKRGLVEELHWGSGTALARWAKRCCRRAARRANVAHIELGLVSR